MPRLTFNSEIQLCSLGASESATVCTMDGGWWFYSHLLDLTHQPSSSEESFPVADNLLYTISRGLGEKRD